MATLVQLPYIVPISAGDSYPGAKINVTQAGTTTNITTYTTAALSVAHANPVVADANGVFAPIYIDDAVYSSYRMRVYTSADVLLKDYDNIPSNASGSYPAGHLYRYGTNTTPGSTDMTAALNAAITDCISTGTALTLPGDDILITDQPTTITGQLTIQGQNPFTSRIVFVPTAANKAALKVSNGASRAERVVLKDFAIYSTDTTYTKIGLDLYDLSVCELERIFIYGSGGSGPSAGACFSGNSNTSIGIRTHGREATSVRDLEIVADRCIVIAANPNTAANDGEDMDHWDWENLYLVGNGNHLIEVDAGLGIMETTFGGYQAWVGGTGGFKINDTRAAPTITSRGIKFKNVRHEQITDSAGYSFNLVFTAPVQQFKLENVLMAAGGHGITINGFERLVLDQVTAAMAAGKNSIVTAGVTSSSVLVMRDCIWQASSNVTLTGLTQILAGAYRSASYAGPADAVYAGQIVDTRVNVEKVTVTCVNATEGLRVTGTTGDLLQVIPQAAGSGASVRTLNNAASDFEPMSFTFETLDLRYRTGTGTSASAGDVNTSAQLSLLTKLFPGTDGSAKQSACGLFAGTGAPNNANGANGDVYFRSDGGALTTIYQRRAGAWVGII